MTVSSIIPVNNYAGNGSTTIFDFDFLIESSEELLVTYINENGEIKVLNEGVDYSVNEIGNESGSYIVFPLEQSSYKVLKPSEVISLSLNLEIKQESEFENSSNLNLKVLEWTFDYIVRLIQMINRKVDRSVKTYEGSDVSPDELIENLIQAKNDAEKFSIKAQECSDNTEEKLLEIQNIYTEATTEIEKLHSDSINDIQSDLTAALVNISNAKVDAVSACEQEVEKAKEYSEETLSSLDEVRDVLEIANNRADTDLSNITSTAYDNINQSKALSTGNVSSNSEVYSDIQNYAHSTFDLSKFSVVGSPTISDDGILTNTSNLNCVLVNNIDLRTANIWEIDLLINIQDTDLSNNICLVFNTDNRLVFQISTDLKISLFTNIGTQNINFSSSVSVIQQGLNKIKLKYDSSSGYNIFVNDIQVASNTTTSKTTANGSFYIGGGYSTLFMNEPNSIDLKSFAIWVDGVTVFNGNKIGQDVIKEDNYEVVGSPTITGDGVASGFTSENYINSSISFDLTSASSIEVHTKFIYNGNDNTLNIINCFGTGVYLAVANQNILRFNDDTVGALLPNRIDSTIEKNIWYDVIYGVTSDNLFYIKYKKHTESSYIMKSVTMTNRVLNNAIFYLGAFGDSSHLYNFVGKIDLNQTKIYIDGNLVYQPCLRIPYVQSITGSKIVDVAYRYRVQDLYTQTGEALYYTIDEQNQNFTLPMGEVYGMITQKANVDLTNLTNGLANVICMTAPTETSTASSQNPAVVIENYVNGTSGYRVYSDGYCEQWGETGQASSSISQTITLLKPFANANYYANSTMTTTGTAKINRITNRTTTQFTIAKDTLGGGDPVTTNLWEAKGYIS